MDAPLPILRIKDKSKTVSEIRSAITLGNTKGDSMKNTVKTGLRAGLKNWSTLLCLRYYIKIIGFSIRNITETLLDAVLKTGNVTFISQENIGYVLSRPLNLCDTSGGLCCSPIMYFEIKAWLFTVRRGWRGEQLSVWALWKQAFLRSLPVFHYKNLPVVIVCRR